MTKRTTVDLVILIFAGVVALAIVAAVVMVAVIAITAPGTDMTTTLDYVYGVVTTILGSLIGLIAGQAKGRADATSEMREHE